MADEERARPAAADPASAGLSEAAAAWLDLTKPRITALVVITAAASFGLASGPPGRLWVTVLATALLASGIFALNQYLERDADGRMVRTRRRALPSGRVPAAGALGMGVACSAAGLALLAFALPPLSAAVGLFTLVSYLFVYTPLKPKSFWHTTIGAFPGATPPLLGWAAAAGALPADAWALAGVVFFWQFPHFIAIEMMYRDDYARAGFRVVPVVDLDGRLTRAHLLVPLLLLFPVSMLPAATGLARPVYAAAAFALSLGFLLSGLAAAREAGGAAARRLLRASVLYLPLLFGLLLLLRM